MLGINFYRAYGADGEHAAARPARIDRGLGVRVDTTNGQLVRSDGTRLRLKGTTIQESGTMMSDAQIAAHVKRIRGNGYNAVRFLSYCGNKKWTGYTGSSWGPFTYDSTDTTPWATISNRWLLNETALVQLDKTIAALFDAGIEFILMSNNDYAVHIERHSSQHARGTYQGYGMMWSDEYRDILKDFLSRFYTRTNTITGIRYCDERRIGWQIDNENGMSDSYTRSTTNAWGGGASVHWWDKIIEGTTDTFGDNGYWYTELNAKLTAWAASADGIAAHVSAGGSGVWTVPLWGRGSTGVADGARGFPKRSVWNAWATGATPERDKDMIVMFIEAMEVEYHNEMIAWMLAQTTTGELIYMPATFHYQSPRASLGLTEVDGVSILVDRHIYLLDGSDVAGTKSGSAVTRKSVMDMTATPNANGQQLYQLNGIRSKKVVAFSDEDGDYGPNRWRYQRAYYGMVTALLQDIESFGFTEGQQMTTGQLLTDGRYMSADHINCASPAHALASRAVAPAHIYGFLSPLASEYSFNSTIESLRTYQKYSNTPRFSTGGYQLMGGSPYTGYAGSSYFHAPWKKRIYYSIDDGQAATSEASIASAYPSLPLATLAAGTFLVDTATEKLFVKSGYGYEVTTPYMAGYVDTLTTTSQINATYAGFNPLTISSMSAAVTCAVCFLRSDGPWPLFTGAMKLYIHGSDYDTTLVTQGGGAGEATFLSGDLVTVNYASGSTWLSGHDATTVRLAMPESFTVSMNTNAAPAPFAGVELEVFKVSAAGIPTRVATTFSSGVTSFSYDATCPEYTVQPIAKRTTSARGRRR